eukprot:983491-Pelagomonas_calceolata.AAC.1
MGGHPMLLSFSGMAEVLKWPARLPLVAPCDRARVLQLWARSCRGRWGVPACVPVFVPAYLWCVCVYAFGGGTMLVGAYGLCACGGIQF